MNQARERTRRRAPALAILVAALIVMVSQLAVPRAQGDADLRPGVHRVPSARERAYLNVLDQIDLPAAR